MIAAENRVTQLKAAQQTLNLNKQLLLSERLEVGKPFAKPRSRFFPSAR